MDNPNDPVERVRRAIALTNRGPWVYFAQNGGTEGPIKIGTTHTDPERRLSSMRTGNPHSMVLLVAIPGGRDEEAALHQRFRAVRIRGEWFRAVGALLDFIDENQRINPLALLGNDKPERESAALKQALDMIEEQAERIAELEAQAATAGGVGGLVTAADFERFAVERALKACAGSTSKAAERLGISTRKIQYLTKRWGRKSP